MHRGAPTPQPAAARAVAHVLDAQRARDDAAESQDTGRRARGRAAVASAIDGEAAARLAVQAAGQQRALLSRLVSRDPTKKARAPVPTPGTSLTQCARDAPDVVDASPTQRQRRRRIGQVNAPITVDEFDEKYATNDPMLHYLISVIVGSRSVTRSEIPRRPERLVDAQQRHEVPEEDVVFLVYHRQPPCGFRNVYWLQFITEDRAIDEEFEYFALSHHGFTHYRGSSVIDFVDVESWVIEKRAFDHMTAMRGLQKLQGLLFFMSWKKKAIRMKHRRVRDRLACSLFQCDSTAAPLLVAIRGCCVTIEELAASHHLPHGVAHTIDYIRQHIRARLKSIRLGIAQQDEDMCRLIEREVWSLRQQRDAEETAERQNYSSVSRSSRLLDRLYVFLRLVDLHRFESLSAHMSEFIAGLHAQICGDNLRPELPTRDPPDQQALHAIGSTAASLAQLPTISIQRPMSIRGAATLVVSYKTHFSLRHREVPPPFVFGQVIDNVRLGSEPSNTQLSTSPNQLEVFDVVYALLNGYVTALDSVPQLLSAGRFSSILAPYTPQNRDKFMASLLKPSTQILLDRTKDMKQMKNAIETYFKQLEILESDLLRLVVDIHVAEENETQKKLANERSSTVASSLLTAAQYEEIRDVWRSLLIEIQQLPRFVQIGVVLLDQSSLLDRLEAYVTNHIKSMMVALPDVYKQCLSDLLEDADGRIERIMNIPTSIRDAIQWLKGMIEMMPTHANRKAFDAKCANLVRLKQLLRDTGASFPSAEDQDFVKKKDYEWESMYETLMTCFARVQERDCEHRRSILELNAKADECVDVQLEHIKVDYGKLPPYSHEPQLSKHKTRELADKKRALIDRLERLVAVHGERAEMLELYATFEMEHRLLVEHSTFDAVEPSRLPQRWVTKSPSELLLQHISVVFDMRAWFCAWLVLEEKWIDTPLVSLHPGMILSRLKQLRRRVQFASTRLLPNATVPPDDEEFMASDYCLVEALEARVDEISNDYVIIQAATCGAFSTDRWQLCQGIMGMESIDQNSITLRMVKSRLASAPHRIVEFKQLCEVVVLESKLRNAAERVRQRLSACEVSVCFTNTFVLLENIQDVALELDDISIETKLLSQRHSPNLEGVLAIHDEVHAKLALCSRLLSFQGVWDELCRLSRVHDIDEFFTGQVAWKGPHQRQKKKAGREESAWGDFVDVGQDWAERLRRLACMSQSSAVTQQPGPSKTRVTASTPTKLACSLEEVQEAFRGFEFELAIAKCEGAYQLVDKYLAMVRDKCPRLYFLNKQQLIQFVVRDDDIETMVHALSICFPSISAFKIVNSRREEEEMLQESGVRSTRGTTNDGSGSLVIKGVTCVAFEQDFNVPVVKVGRLWFWLTRLEEEMGSLVTENAKHAVTAAFRRITGSDCPVAATDYQHHLPQSVQLALTLVFTSTVESVFWSQNARDSEAPSNSSALCRSSSELKELYIKQLDTVIDFASGAGTHRLDARLDSMILLLQHQCEVSDHLHTSIEKGRADEAAFLWDTQLKIDFMMEDLSAKTSRRFRACDQPTWTDCAMLGPSFPVTFLATCGQSEFFVGQEMSDMRRIPVITPLTQRCFFQLIQTLRSHQLALVAPVNPTGRGGQGAMIKGMAQILMRPTREMCRSRRGSTSLETLANLLKSTTSMGCFLSIPDITELSMTAIRVVVEHVNQLRQNTYRGFISSSPATPEQRVSLSLAPTGCVFVPLNCSSDGQSCRVRQVLFGSTADAFHPVAIYLPNVAYFTKTLALLAGFKITEIPKLQSVVNFLESLTRLSPVLDHASSGIYRFISHLVEDVSRYRSNYRVLLPSNPKWSKKFAGAGNARSAPQRISKFFRRSADAHDVSDIVIDTLFHHAITARYKGFLSTLVSSTTRSLENDLIELAERCFPCAKGCELTLRSTQTQEQALWDAMEMSLAQAGLVTTTAGLVKALELYETLQSSAAVVVVGAPGAGKTTCIRTLHNALQALELAESATSESGIDYPTQRSTKRDWSQLVCVSSRFLSTDSDVPDERTRRLLGDILKVDGSGVDMIQRRWLCVDGVIDESRAEAFVREYSRGWLQNHTNPKLVAASRRIILETTSLEQATPSFLVQTRVVHVSQTVTSTDLVSSWRDSWTKKMPFPEESRGYENAEVVFRMTELFISGPVQQFVMGEENLGNLEQAGGAQDRQVGPTHLGMLSLNHLTSACLQLVSVACLTHRSQLEERSATQLTRLVAFCVIWGFAGHLSEVYRQKLDSLLCPIVKQLVEVRQANESPEGLYDSERLGDDFWESIHLPLRGTAPPDVIVKDQTKSSVSRVIVDSTLLNRVLVVSSASLSLVRVLRLLLHSTASFVVVGPRGSGKSSLLRVLLAMNAEDQAAESLVDVSLDDRYAPEVLNWLNKPRTWFDRPATESSNTSQFRSKAADEAQLFKLFSAGAAKFVFLDDLAMTDASGAPSPAMDAVDEFVRVGLDHRMAINWTSDRVVPFAKEFAASMTTRQAGTPKVRVPHHMERLVRHFSVFRMPHQDRQHLQGIFRHVYADWFVSSTVSMAAGVLASVPAPTRPTASNDRVLSLPEVVLRASVDLAVDVLTVQQTTERLELVDGFTFNLHHLNELLSRCLSFVRLLGAANESSADAAGGATLLSLGKLHQCWSSSVRSIFLSPCSHRAPRAVEDELSTDLPIDEIKKVVQSTKLASEKYFSVPAREDPHVALVTDIVYGVYRYLADQSDVPSSVRAEVGELLTANASATSSSSTTRRNGISEAGGTVNSGSVLARDEFAVRVARELVFKRVAPLLSDKSDVTRPVNLGSRSCQRLHIGSSAGLHQLLHVVHGIRCSAGILVDQPLSSTLRDVFRLAYAMENYDVVEIDDGAESRDGSIRAQVENTLSAAITRGKRAVVCVHLDTCGGSPFLTDMITALCAGKVNPILYESESLRDEAVVECVRGQRNLRLLSCGDAVMHFHDALRQNLRMFVVATQHGGSGGLVELMRGSAAFQWVSFQEKDLNSPRYRGEVVRQAIHELTGQTQVTVSRQVSVETRCDTREVSSWGTLHSLCDGLFDVKDQRWSEDMFLMFIGNVVADCTRRVQDYDNQVDQHAQLAHALEEISSRVPRLQTQARLFSARMHQLDAWHDELQQPLMDIQAQLRDRMGFMLEQEAELPSDELRALQRRIQKLETQVWAHRATMDEYKLAKAEVACRLRELDTELRHWHKYGAARECVEVWSKTHLDQYQLVRGAQERLLQLSVEAYSVMLDTKMRTEDLQRDLSNSADEPRGCEDGADRLVTQLWRSRFPFLRKDLRAERILSAADNVRDRIPLIIDRSSLFQAILVHIFSNVPWFTDASEEFDRRDAIGYTVTGAVAPMIVQCDGGPKMWRKLHEAVQKEAPVLLVGVSVDLIEPLSRFARQLPQRPRSTLLSELTHEAYRSQLKRDVHPAKHPSHGSTHADPTMPSHPIDDRNSRRPGMASADFKSISAALVTSGAARRGSTGDPKGALARRLSLTLTSGAVAASKTFGFQIYAVTEHAIDRAVVESTGQFAGIEADWQPRSVETFFTEGGMRWYDKKLHKDILDTRRIESDSTYRVLQAESAVWSIVRSQTCTSPSEREEFMVRLEELSLELQRHRAQLEGLPARLTAVESRLEEVKAIGLKMAIVARATETFARCVSPSGSMFVRSHRLLEQLMETTIAAWMKNDRDSSLQLSCEDWATKVGGLVATQVIQSVMTGLPSASHQRIFLAILASTDSVWASVEGSAVDMEARDDLVPPALAWLLWSGGTVWSRPAQAPTASIVADKEAYRSMQAPGESQGTDGIGAASASAPPSGPTTTGLSLVERLRRKVRVCSLMFDQIGNAKSKELTEGAEGGSSTKAKNKPTAKQPIATHTKVKPSSEESGVLDTANKMFRSVARIVRTLWCEWKLAKEDQHADVRREIASVLGNQVSRLGIGGLRRRHHSVKDMTLASTSVTQLVCLDDLVSQYLGVEATSEWLASRSLDERLVVVMVAKAHFPQRFQTEWDRCLAASGAQVHSVEMSTTQLLRLDGHNSTGATPDPTFDAGSQPNMIALQQLPLSIDVAWRRDDLVHLPTRVLLYEPTEERSTIEVLLLRARESTQPQPLRLFAVVAWEQCASRLEQQLTASVTGKERFAVEISHHDHFSCVITLVSSIINQHALLCIPEWYVISTLQVFERVHSPEMGYHRIHVVRQAAEPVSVKTQLTQWLIRNGGLGETEARTAANVLLRHASADGPDATPLVPLSASVDALISKLKTVAQSGESPARQRRLKQLVLTELGLDAEELPTHRTVEAREHCVQETKASLEFLGDLLLLPPLTAPRTTERELPATISDLEAQLEMLCDALSQELDRSVGSPNPMSADGPRQLWRSLLSGEHEATLRRVRVLRQLLRDDKATDLARRRIRDRALTAQGIVPVDWLTEHFPELSDACLSNVVSVAQVLVLLVSRLGFTLHDLSSDPPATLNVSLLNNPRSVVARLRDEYATRAGCDPADVTFALQPGILQADQTDSKETEATAATQRGRRSSQPFARGLDQVGRQSSTGVAEKPIAASSASCLVVGADGSLSGLQIEGLVAVERVTPQNGGGTSQVFIHELPVCRLVCQHRQVDATQRTTTRVDAASATASSRQLTSENVVTARLKQEGVRWTTIASTSAFQALPDSFWSPPGRQEPGDSETILPRVTVTHALLVSVPSLARMRPEQDSVSIVLAVPVFPTDDDDQD